MTGLDNNNVLIVLGIAAIAVEMFLGAATGFDLLLSGIIFIISGLLGKLLGNFNAALICVAVLSFLYLFFGRKFIQKKIIIETKSTNIDSLPGKKGIVVKKIVPHHPGQVKVEGEIWRAEAEKEIDINQTVTVKSVSGVTLKVVPE